MLRHSQKARTGFDPTLLQDLSTTLWETDPAPDPAPELRGTWVRSCGWPGHALCDRVRVRCWLEGKGPVQWAVSRISSAGFTLYPLHSTDWHSGLRVLFLLYFILGRWNAALHW